MRSWRVVQGTLLPDSDRPPIAEPEPPKLLGKPQSGDRTPSCFILLTFLLRAAAMGNGGNGTKTRRKGGASGFNEKEGEMGGGGRGGVRSPEVRPFPFPFPASPRTQRPQEPRGQDAEGGRGSTLT